MSNVFPLWRYDHELIFRKFYKMEPRWRHQWRSMLKTLLCFVHMPIHVCAKFEGIWLSHFQVIVHTKKWLDVRKKNKGNSNEIIRWSVRYTAHLITFGRYYKVSAFLARWQYFDSKANKGNERPEYPHISVSRSWPNISLFIYVHSAARCPHTVL